MIHFLFNIQVYIPRYCNQLNHIDHKLQPYLFCLDHDLTEIFVETDTTKQAITNLAVIQFFCLVRFLSEISKRSYWLNLSGTGSPKIRMGLLTYFEMCFAYLCSLDNRFYFIYLYFIWNL